MTKEILLNISLIKETEGGYSAICNELDVASQGETIEEALANIKEAVELYIESAADMGILEQVKEKLGIEELREGLNIPNIFKTEMSVTVAA